jgi:hypothetical protein
MRAFLDYVHRFDPDFGARIRGADDAAIARLAALYGRPLPASYVAFLSVMGADLGGFRVLGDASADLVSVYERAAEIVDDPFFAELLDRCVVIGEQMFMGVDLCLDDRGEGEPRVVAADVEILFPVAHSLRHLLMRQAFAIYAMRVYPHRGAWAGHTDDPLDAHGRAAEALGFTALDFSDQQGWCGERPGARLRISNFQDEPKAWMVASDDPALVQEIGLFVGRRWSLDAGRVDRGA